MSYILDALKKSDQERNQGGVPNLQTVHIPVSVESQTPWVLYGFISILLLVLAFVIGLVVSKNVSVTVEQADIEVTTAEVAAKTKMENTNKSTLTPVEASIQVVEARKDIYQDLSAINVGTPTDTRQDSVNEPKKTRISAVKLPDINDIPYLHELQDYQQQSVPEMTFAGHMYSANPVSRSVIINNVAMSEGDTIIQGINVVEITQSGVIFSLHDEYFRMDILQDWSF